MKIDITKDEYRNLLDVLFIADWVLHAFDTGNRARVKRYDMVVQKLYAYAAAFGFDRLIDVDRTSKKYFVSQEFESTTDAWGLVDDFTNDIFWDELIHRLTERDIVRKVGGYDHIDKLPAQEYMDIETPLLERYSAEFDEAGLERLEIVGTFSPPPASRPETHD
ncbi:MAG TPA: hypothetical protein VK654_08430 [Nitrospirota bacterium]|nr:hypothetical protein [Nitrospirota bacterium]